MTATPVVVAESPSTVRDAREDELAAVMNVLDGGALEVDAATVRERIPGDVLVAVDGDRVLGVCVVEHRGACGVHGRNSEGEVTTTEVEAVAVRHGRRGQGIGSALVAAAAERWGPLTAEFDARVRPFYEALEFDVEPIDEDRFRGVHPVGDEGGTRSGGQRG